MKKALQVASVASMIDQFTMDNIKLLQEEGYQVDVAANFDFGSTSSKERIEEFKVILSNENVRVNNILFDRSVFSILNIKAYRKLKKLINENDYKIIHCHSPIGGVITRLAAKKARKKGAKIIYTAHGFHFYKGAPLKNWLLYYPVELICSRLTDILITINSEDFNIAKRRFKAKKCCLINGVGLDLTKYKKLSDEQIKKKRIELGFADDDFIIIMIAELNENKNQIQLIKAMELLKDKYPKIKAILVGQGHKMQQLKKEVSDRGLENNISFLGFRPDVNELINISNIGTLLSYREGLPKSVMEILVNKKRVIGTDIRGIKDLISNSNAGELVQIGDFENTSKIIEKYYKDFLMKKKIIYKNIIEDFDLKNIKKQIKKIF